MDHRYREVTDWENNNPRKVVADRGQGTSQPLLHNISHKKDLAGGFMERINETTRKNYEKDQNMVSAAEGIMDDI